MASFCEISKFSKNAIFAIFWEFLVLVVLDSKRHKKCQKMKIFQIHVLYNPTMLSNTQDDDLWSWDRILRSIENHKIFHIFQKICNFGWKMTLSYDFQYFLKYDLMIINHHCGYLEASLGYKEREFEKVSYFDIFCAFLNPKRPT